MGTLTGKVAIVTGAGRGMGRAIAIEFGKEGAHVVVSSRSAGSIDEVVQIIKAGGGEATGITCDVSRAEDLRATVDATVKIYGGVDILVNNAQSFGTRDAIKTVPHPTPLEDFDEPQWDWVFETGVKATLRMMQAVFPHMKARGGGRIINFASPRGLSNTPGTAGYNAAKEAIRSLSRTAANEWGKHQICVNVINPIVATESSLEDMADLDHRNRVIGTIPLKRMGEPWECGRLAVFLAGPDAAYITGMDMRLDGGLMSRP